MFTILWGDLLIAIGFYFVFKSIKVKYPFAVALVGAIGLFLLISATVELALLETPVTCN